MSKRKAISSSGSDEEYERIPKKSKSSFNQSIIQAANFMSKNQALHKSLNLTSSLLLPNSNEKTKKKTKVKKKEVVSPSGSSESEEDVNHQIISKPKKHEDISNTNPLFEKERKSKSPKKRNSKDKSFEAFTPKIVTKVKASLSGSSESEEEVNRQIIPKHNKHEEINNTNSSVEKERKSKSPNKRNSKDKSFEDFTPKIIPKVKASPSGSSESEEEVNRQIIPKHKKHEEIINTNSSVETERKSKRPKKRNSKDKSVDAISPKIVPKKEIVEGLVTFDSSEDSDLNSSKKNNNSHSNIEAEDVNMMNSIEEKVQKVRVLQDVRISPSKDPKQQLRDIYPNLQQKNIKTKIKLGDSDEIFLFRAPKNVDIQNLLNTSIDLEEGGKINIGEKFIIRPTSKIPHPTLLLSSLTKIFCFKQNIVMEKYMKTPKQPKLPVNENTVIPLPNDLKNRHPLFGNDFEEKIQLDVSVEKKLNHAINNLLKQGKKVRRKKLKRDLEEEKDELVFSLLESKSVKRKKHNKNEESNVTLTPHKSPKKKKVTKNDLIEETLRQMKQELQTEYESDCETGVPKKKKHKKKLHSATNVNVKQEVSDWTVSPAMTPKALRRLSLANSTMLPNASKLDNFNPELSSISGVFSEELIFTKDKKKKKSKKEPLDGDSREESTHHLSPSKKLKIKHEPEEGFPVKKKKKL